jgi:hypothetical protein
MKVRFLGFTRLVSELQTAPSDRSCVLSSAVALAVASHLPLPSAAVDAPASYYNFTNLQSAKDLVGMFNEEVVFDVKEALESTREFWMLRYNAAHAPTYPVINPSIGFYDNLLGVAKWVDQESHAFNNQYKMEIFALAQAARAVIDSAD